MLSALRFIAQSPTMPNCRVALCLRSEADAYKTLAPTPTFFVSKEMKKKETLSVYRLHAATLPFCAMARTIRDAKLETKAARARLAPNRKPYWKTLARQTSPGLSQKAER